MGANAVIFGDEWITVILIALVIDIVIGEFPIKHPIELMGDFIKYYEKKWYKNSVFRGGVLFICLVFITGIITITCQLLLPSFLLGILASTGLASKCLKIHIKDVLTEDNPELKRKKLSYLVTRNTENLDDNKVYSSLIETHSENLSDGVISPLFYFILFGFPGLMVFKAVSTLDSVVGFKNEKYINFGRVSAIADDILNYVPARLTCALIWVFSKYKTSFLKILKDAPKYSSSPNAGYPVAAAAYGLRIKVGGRFYYGDMQVDKAEIGTEKTIHYKQAACDFIKIHTKIEIIILVLFTVLWIAGVH